jgi:hypothetical protein
LPDVTPPPLDLAAALAAWGTPAFAGALKAALEARGAALPLQRGLAAGSVALDERIEVMYLGADEEPERLRVRVGVFFAGILAGCSCADDPTPVEPQNEYCELELLIDKASGEARATVSD